MKNFKNYLFTFILFTATLWLALPTPLQAQLVNPVKDSMIQFTDITTNNASASKHGFLPKLENSGTKFLRDDGSWQTPAGGGVSILGNLDAVSSTAKGASMTSDTLYLQSASASAPGLVNTTTQSIAGDKTLLGTLSTANISLGGVMSGGSVSGTSMTILSGSLLFRDSANLNKMANFSFNFITSGTTRTYTFPDGSASLVTDSATQTLTSKTFSGGTVSGATTTILDGSGFSIAHAGGKRVQWNIDTAVSNTTVVLTTPAVSTTILGANLATTKGDILAATASNTVTRLGVGADGYALVASSTQTTGLAYQQIVGRWTNFTPTGSWVTNTTYTGKYRQVGENYEYDILVTTSGAPTATTLTVTLNATIDTAKMTSTTNFIMDLGQASIVDAGSQYYQGLVRYASTTTVGVFALATNGAWAVPGSVSEAIPFTFGSTDFVHLRFTVPIVGL
jgi:hypothetical protein